MTKKRQLQAELDSERSANDLLNDEVSTLRARVRELEGQKRIPAGFENGRLMPYPPPPGSGFQAIPVFGPGPSGAGFPGPVPPGFTAMGFPGSAPAPTIPGVPTPPPFTGDPTDLNAVIEAARVAAEAARAAVDGTDLDDDEFDEDEDEDEDSWY